MENTCGGSVDLDAISVRFALLEQSLNNDREARLRLELDMSIRYNDALSGIRQQYEVVASANSTMAQTLTTLSSELNNAKATVSSLSRTLASTNSATAQTLTAVAASLAEANGKVEKLYRVTAETSDGITSILAEASVLTTVNGKISGWKNLNNGEQSSFAIIADNFYVWDGTSNYKPFSVSNGVVTFQGAATDAVAREIANNAAQAADGAVTLDEVEAWIASTNYVLATEVADAVNNNTTKINGSKIVAGTIYADTIAANSIAVASSYTIVGTVSAIASFGSSLTIGNTNSVGSFAITNTSTITPQKLLLTAAGRTGFGGVDGNATSQSFGIFANGAKLFDYGWTPAGQDSKAGCCTFSMSPNSSVTVDIRTAKTNPNDILTMYLTCSILGVKN